ncbi:MAG: hypothetical protein OEW33_15085 [Nitrospirota bacterium]|nr:hypothetical protein [Nitrospirota bacterium]
MRIFILNRDLLLQAVREQHDPRGTLAIEVFCHRAGKYLGPIRPSSVAQMSLSRVAPKGNTFRRLTLEPIEEWPVRNFT